LNLSGTIEHPGFGQSMDYQAHVLSGDPDTQVAQTIHRMRRNVREDSGSQPIQRDAAMLAAYGSGDPLYDAFWLDKGRVGFQRDELLATPVASTLDGPVVEVLIRPRDLADMANPLEDCDGFSSLIAARARAAGIPCSFVTIAADARQPDRYSHVYLACYRDGQRIPLDVSHGPYPGWEAPNVYGKKKEWPIDGPDWDTLLLAAAVIVGLYYAAKWAGIL
jgi:hypothetical protein